eukprot:598970-Pelagomonas_calceolata.AAC.10
MLLLTTVLRVNSQRDSSSQLAYTWLWKKGTPTAAERHQAGQAALVIILHSFQLVHVLPRVVMLDDARHDDDNDDVRGTRRLGPVHPLSLHAGSGDKALPVGFLSVHWSFTGVKKYMDT